VSTDAGKIAQEIVQHLNALPDTEVRITLEISANVPSGVPDKVVRILAENGKTLNYRRVRVGGSVTGQQDC
jgi:hypothetical protein